MGCSGSKTIPLPQSPTDFGYHEEEESIREPTPEPLSPSPEPETASDDVELIAGEYDRVEEASYDADPDVDAPVQAGAGTWGSGDRFLTSDNGVPGHKYDLPEVTGTDTCNAVFGKITGERFPDMDNGVPGAKYDLPEVTGTDTCNGVFGKMTEERFPDFYNDVPGAGAYDLPEVTGTDPCHAVFGSDKTERMMEPKDDTKKAFGRYEVLTAFNKAARGKSNQCGFGRATSARFTTPKRTNSRMLNTRKSWTTKGGGTFGKTSASRFGPSRNW